MYKLLNPVLAVIPEGRENARIARDLADLLNWTPREFTRAVQRLRVAGVPIGAVCTEPPLGFYVCASDEECADYVRRFEMRICEQQKTLDGLRAFKGKRKTAGQGGYSNTDV
jgi:hypothetical protein